LSNHLIGIPLITACSTNLYSTVCDEIKNFAAIAKKY